jgi:predicted nucleotidyltransferase
MGKNEIIKILKAYKDEFAEQYSIKEIGVFGSVARNENGDDSDIDVVVHIQKPDLFILSGIKQDLEERFKKPVDVITYRENMNQFLKKRIDQESVYA